MLIKVMKYRSENCLIKVPSYNTGSLWVLVLLFAKGQVQLC